MRPDDIHRWAWLVLALTALLMLIAIGSARAEIGYASFYWQGQRTASGERFNPEGMTCAHRSRPFGQVVKVTWGTRSVLCRVNDRGPFIAGRVIDLSLGAARLLGIVGVGVALVRLE